MSGFSLISMFTGYPAAAQAGSNANAGEEGAGVAGEAFAPVLGEKMQQLAGKKDAVAPVPGLLAAFLQRLSVAVSEGSGQSLTGDNGDRGGHGQQIQALMDQIMQWLQQQPRGVEENLAQSNNSKAQETLEMLASLQPEQVEDLANLLGASVEEVRTAIGQMIAECKAQASVGMARGGGREVLFPESEHQESSDEDAQQPKSDVASMAAVAQVLPFVPVAQQEARVSVVGVMSDSAVPAIAPEYHHQESAEFAEATEAVVSDKRPMLSPAMPALEMGNTGKVLTVSEEIRMIAGDMMGMMMPVSEVYANVSPTMNAVERDSLTAAVLPWSEAGEVLAVVSPVSVVAVQSQTPQEASPQNLFPSVMANGNSEVVAASFVPGFRPRSVEQVIHAESDATATEVSPLLPAMALPGDNLRVGTTSTIHARHIKQTDDVALALRKARGESVSVAQEEDDLPPSPSAMTANVTVSEAVSAEVPGETAGGEAAFGGVSEAAPTEVATVRLSSLATPKPATANAAAPQPETAFRTPFNATPPAPVVEQVVLKMRDLAQDEGKRIEIHLDPKDLGKVDVQMDVDSSGRTQITMTADRRETLDMLQRDRVSLEKALNEAGIKADAGSMSFNLREQPKGQQQLADQQRNQDNGRNWREDVLPENLREEAQPLQPYRGGYVISLAEGVNISV